MVRRCFSSALLLVLAVLIIGLVPHTADACTCEVIEPDRSYQRAVLVFTGTVEKVDWLTREVIRDGKPVLDPDGRPTFRSEGHLARLVVDEYFKGTGGTEIELQGTGTSCDFGFEAGKKYLVYASPNGKGGMGAFSCSRTRQLNDHAKPDISYMRRAARGALPTMLYGFAFRRTGESKLGESEPLGELAVTVEGGEKSLQLKTDARGYFETFDLAPGNYRVRTGVTGKLRGAEEKAVELASSGVASVMFHTTTMGSLSGRVVDQEGRPVNGLQVNLLLAKGVTGARPVVDYDETEEDGRFSLDEVPAGRYVLAVNFAGRRSLNGAPFMPSYFPKAASSIDADVITITDGVPVELGDFILQKRYPTVEISGVVVTPDGKPVPGAPVYLEQSGGDRDSSKAVWTDAGGRFVQQAFESVTYTLRAIAHNPTSVAVESERVEVKAAKDTPPVRLIIKLPK
jgi:hypothetical protein